ncbi:MAG: translation initiation factor IF-3 [Planctomycetota bacterium]
MVTAQHQYRINLQIKVPEVRLIDDKGEQRGVVRTEEARRSADEAGLDLVEVAPEARPPVCKIMDYGKFKYLQKKREQDQRKKSHAAQLKELRLRPKIDTHDRDFKVNRARTFLESGHKVQFNMLFRGREMAHQDVGREVMDKIVEALADVSKVERPPRMEGRRMTVLLTHK